MTIHYKFKLYIAGDAPNSQQALNNISTLCREHLPRRYSIEIVDVIREPNRALSEGILLTPTLVKCSPSPICKIVGNLGNFETVLQAIGLRAQTA